MTIHTRRCERGYAMAALLVAMSVMAIVLSTAMPVFQTAARREREAELVFRGEQYARAIGLFQRKYANANPPDVDVLVRERFLRKKYKDPMTGGDFVILGAGSPELAQAMGTTPQQLQDAQRGAGARGVGAGRAGGATTGTAPATGRGQGGVVFGRGQTGQNQTGQTTNMVFGAGRGPITAAGQAANVQAGGGIVAVTSKSKDTSMRLYNGKNKYNEWIFMALQTSNAAGTGARGAQTPGGRGGQVPGGRGGTAIPGGRGNTTSPFGRSTPPQGRGFSPMGAGGR
jgi:type II secretory pathway pseudopilin PulG